MGFLHVMKMARICRLSLRCLLTAIIIFFVLMIMYNLFHIIDISEKANAKFSIDRLRALGVFKKINVDVSQFGSVCHTPQCIALYESKVYYNDSVRRIPTLRHILWRSDHVSNYFAKQLKTWNAIHPDWTYVLWRDSDMEKFVAKYYSGVLKKFKHLKPNIAKIDMIRYCILHHFGGVYADLDYVLVRPLDRFLKFPAVITREVETHAFFQLGMSTFPPPILGNPAFMMSEPGHQFFLFSIMQLNCRNSTLYFHFAGPLGLTEFLAEYEANFPVRENPDGVVIVPASRTFYSFDDNSLRSGTSVHKEVILKRIKDFCNERKKQPSMPKALSTYCMDVYNLDPITDRSELVYAVHDFNKSFSSYDGSHPMFDDTPVDIRTILPNIIMAETVY